KPKDCHAAGRTVNVVSVSPRKTSRIAKFRSVVDVVGGPLGRGGGWPIVPWGCEPSAPGPPSPTGASLLPPHAVSGGGAGVTSAPPRAVSAKNGSQGRTAMGFVGIRPP